MRFDYAGLAVAAWLSIPLAAAHAQPVSSRIAQNTYSGSAVPGDDSILPPGPDPYIATNALSAAKQEVEAAETNLNISAGVMHTQYHENALPGDDESGFTPGFGVGGSVLLPLNPRDPESWDLYTALQYDFNAGGIKYAGHFQADEGGAALEATDRAVFQRIEARIGVGFPMIGGIESIPFFAFGYQSWDRNVDSPGTVNGGEFYHSGLFGLGWKLDVPVTSKLVFSGTGDVLALAGGGVNNPDLTSGITFGRGFGVTPEERIELGLDDAVSGHFHLFAKGFWEHFNYSGTHPEYYYFGYAYEPLSTTTQFGLNFGAAYSF